MGAEKVIGRVLKKTGQILAGEEEKPIITIEPQITVAQNILVLALGETDRNQQLSQPFQPKSSVIEEESTTKVIDVLHPTLPKIPATLPYTPAPPQERAKADNEVSSDFTVQGAREQLLRSRNPENVTLRKFNNTEDKVRV